MGGLAEDGFGICQDHRDADIIIVNTCGFIAAAREESLDTIQRMVALKRRGRARAVVVAGCMAQRYRDELWKSAPGIDGVIGLSSYDGLGRLCRELYHRHAGEVCLVRPTRTDTRLDVARLRLTPSHYAYLKISEGCSNTCSFCAIPKIRGKHRSKPLEDCLREARELVDSGARELLLIAEDTTSWGRDLPGEPDTGDLLTALDGVESLRWIKLLYAYPARVSEGLIEALRDRPRVCRYLDLPLQHISDRMLARMRRNVTEAQVRALVDELRARVPGITLRTTFITGFPGETDEDFEVLLDFVRQARFERLGAFVYSSEEGTPAARYDEQVPAALARERLGRLMEAQREIVARQQAQRLGERLEVIVDGADAAGRLVCRSQSDVPDVDGEVLVDGARTPGEVRAGDFIACEVTGHAGYDLLARAIP